MLLFNPIAHAAENGICESHAQRAEGLPPQHAWAGDPGAESAEAEWNGFLE